MSDKVTITLKNGKSIDVDFIQPGLYQKTATMFYIKDSVTGEFLYAFPARIVAMRKKNNNDFSNYKGRATKEIEREQAKVEKAERKATKAIARDLKKQAKEEAKAKRIVERAEAKVRKFRDAELARQAKATPVPVEAVA
jgi:flagellar biosynthesis GTPase FlhF